jgi:hypothetical protein
VSKNEMKPLTITIGGKVATYYVVDKRYHEIYFFSKDNRLVKKISGFYEQQYKSKESIIKHFGDKTNG